MMSVHNLNAIKPTQAKKVFAVLKQNEMENIAKNIARQLRGGELIFLQGDLGAGKTTFARALIQTLIPGQRVKSPTYSLMERYETENFVLVHVDLYRLVNSDELAPLELTEQIAQACVLIIEWPERLPTTFANPDWWIVFEGAGESRRVEITANAKNLVELA